MSIRTTAALGIVKAKFAWNWNEYAIFRLREYSYWGAVF